MPFLIKKWPTRSQWRHFFKVLKKKERILLLILTILFISSSATLITRFYLQNTEEQPAQGGTYTEGIIGQPRFINPIYANSDPDRDLTELIFSGLMKYDQNLQVVPDLVQGYEVEEEGKVYKFYLKEDILWQDETPLTADDIVFTIKTIQDPEYKSPFQANWVGIEVEKINDHAVKFILRKPYNAFLENCTVKILPKHIWQDVPPSNFVFDKHNLEPIGSGPYQIKETKQEKNDRIKSITLKKNPLYHGQKPYISEIKFNFFETEKDLIKSAQQKKIKGLALSPSIFKELSEKSFAFSKWQDYHISLPRYFAVFFNPTKSDVLEQKEIRVALNHATNKKQIVQEILGLSDASLTLDKTIVDSPILPKVYGFNLPETIYEYDSEKSKTILEEAGFQDKNNDGIRENSEKTFAFQFTKDLRLESSGTEVEELQKCLAKFPDVYPEGEVTTYFGKKTEQAVINFQEKYKEEILEPWNFTEGTGQVSRTTRSKLNEVCFTNLDTDQPLTITLTTVDQPELVAVAEELKKQWAEIGILVEIDKLSVSELEQNVIKPREYEALLFGEVLGAIPDLFPFWHSTQKIDPGLNLAIYQNQQADKLLEDIRKSSDIISTTEKLNQFQNVLINDAPVVFLYCPEYIYSVSKDIKGINTNKITEPSKRFIGIETWYIKTKRVWK